MTDRTLEDRVAIVCGAGDGIGRSCALAFARDGADVALGARNANRLARIADEVRAAGRRALAVPTDITDLAQCRNLVEHTVGEFGRVDVVVNVATAADQHTTVEDTDWDEFRRHFETNVLGVLEVSRAAAAAMRRTGGGAIVQISTGAIRSMPARRAAYTSTKQALVTASQVMAREVGRDGVRVNVVAPGYVTGATLDRLFADTATKRGRSVEEVTDEAAAQSALHRFVDPDDVAEAVLFLASDRSSAITGIVLDINAGMWIG
jgi:NAD(P)-dependent dehydrogenase (short-subunit alcohol dehydrogenase family)